MAGWVDEAGASGAEAGALALGKAGTGWANTGAGAEPAEAGADALLAASVLPLNLLNSLMLRVSSSARLAVSRRVRSLASRSSAELSSTLFLARVNLSAPALPTCWSSSLACTVPLDCRLWLSICVAWAIAANFRRKSLKSWLCAAMMREASGAGVCADCCAVGITRTAPAWIRLTFSSRKTPGLARSRATNIWSKDTPDGFKDRAIAPAVSPDRTVTVSGPSLGVLSGLASLGLVPALAWANSSV